MPWAERACGERAEPAEASMLDIQDTASAVGFSAIRYPP